MSVSLDGSTQYLYAAWSGHGGAYPFSISAWIKADLDTANQVVASVDQGDSGGVNQLYIDGATAGDPVGAGTYVSGWGIASTSTGFTKETWHHICAVFAAANDRRVYIDGGSKGTDATNKSGAGSYELSIGCRYGHPGGSAPAALFDGRIAEVAIWTSALSDANVVSLAGGAAADTVDSGNLDEYWWLYEDADSNNSGTNLTEVGSPTYSTGDHPVSHPTYVDLAGTGTLTLGGTANLIRQYVSLGGTGAISLAGTADLVLPYVNLAGTGALALSGQMRLTRLGVRIPTKTKRRAVAIGNNRVYYEDA